MEPGAAVLAILIVAAIVIRLAHVFVGGIARTLLNRENLEGAAQELSSLELKKRTETIEALGVNVTRMETSDMGFLLHTDDNRHFRSLSVIYCAGKEYQRLGVPGEEKFIGKGIGFCATCDAPLYRGRRVAVVGAGPVGQFTAQAARALHG